MPTTGIGMPWLPLTASFQGKTWARQPYALPLVYGDAPAREFCTEN